MTDRDSNRYPANCDRCGERVEAGKGWLIPDRPGEPWRVVHPDCVPVSRSSAILSPCGLYRYRLERHGPGDGATAIIMVNPSTADASENDPTIRKLLGFGEIHGWGKLIVGNLYAYRATDVRELAAAADPVGPDNGHRLTEVLLDADRVVFAWGPLAKQPLAFRDRQWRDVWNLAKALGCQPMQIAEPCGDGQPRHPLMPGYSSLITPWEPSL